MQQNYRSAVLFAIFFGVLNELGKPVNVNLIASNNHVALTYFVFVVNRQGIGEDDYTSPATGALSPREYVARGVAGA